MSEEKGRQMIRKEQLITLNTTTIIICMRLTRPSGGSLAPKPRAGNSLSVS